MEKLHKVNNLYPYTHSKRRTGLEYSTSTLRMASIILVGKYDDLGEMGVQSMIILKWITSKYSHRTGTWTGLK